MAKRVVLVNPGKHKPWASILPPMNLGYLASYLEKHGVEAYIVDELAGQDVEEVFECIRPDIVGITATTPMVPDAYRVAKIAREFGFLTVMGGTHATVLPEEALQHVDIVVIGEGEKAMLDIVDGNRAKILRTSYIKDLDEIPHPAWHLIDMEFYLNSRNRLPGTHLAFIPPQTRVGSIMTTRGCPYSCIFCYNSWRDVPVRFHSAERVISDIKFLVNRYNIQALYFVDDDLLIKKERIKKICQLMKENKINLMWSCQARADSIDIETLKIIKRSGCHQVQFGFESGSQRILDILKNRTTTIEQNVQAIKLCKQVGISTLATFMLGNPTETVEDIKATFQFIRNNDIDRIGVLITTPFPGTKLWEWCKEHNLIPEKIDYSMFTTDQIAIPACDTIPPKVVEQFRQEIHSYFYSLTLSRGWDKIRRNPFLLYKVIRHPAKSIGLLREWANLKLRGGGINFT